MQKKYLRNNPTWAVMTRTRKWTLFYTCNLTHLTKPCCHTYVGPNVAKYSICPKTNAMLPFYPFRQSFNTKIPI